MQLLRERIAYYLAFLFGGAWFLICSGLGIAWLAIRPGNRQTLYVFGKVFCRVFVRAVGCRIDVRNHERLEQCRPCVIVANHQSFVDVATFGSFFPARTVSAGKREIGRIPVFGWFYRLSGNLTIDRQHARSAHDSLAAAALAMRQEQISVWFMPEGHRNTSGTLLPFKSGAFRLAIAAGVPILPIVAAPIATVIDPPNRRLRRGTLEVRVLDPVPTAGLSTKDVPALSESVRAAMQRAIDELRGAGPEAAAAT
ncbi:MAG: lysophospholipid acyltransferase family protein [Thermoanaerobaculia bacterium]